MPFIQRILASFSFVGLIFGLTLFCASLTPSLLPRGSVDQGVLSGFVFATGYGIGRAGHWIWKFMERRDVTGRSARIVTWILVGFLILIAIYTLNQMTTWQNSIRLRMEMTLIDSAYPVRVLCLAIGTAFLVILLMRLLLYATGKVVMAVDRYLPRRIAIVVG